MKTVIDKITRVKLYDTNIEDVFLNENEELVDFISEQPIEVIIVPQEVQLWRARTVLKLLGMEQVIEVALNSLDEPTKTGALYIWQFGTTVERNSQTVLLLQTVLGLTDTQVDDIFIQAENIQL
jgi:hypothetical protein